MKRRESAIISAYTGILCGKFTDYHKYVEEIMNRPVFTHEMASPNLMQTIKQRAEKDFLHLCENLED